MKTTRKVIICKLIDITATTIRIIFKDDDLLFPSHFIKKTYGHKYYVAASIGFEEKSYPFIRKMKWPTRALNLGVWGGFLPKFFVLIFGLSLDKICWLFHRPCIGLYRKQAKIIKAIPSQNVQVGTLKMQTGWDTGTPKMRTIWDTGTLKMQTKCWDTGTLKMQTGWDTGTSKMWKIKKWVKKEEK